MKLKRVCLHCEKEFVAKTSVTKYCSHKCNQRHYKIRMRNKKIERSNAETFSQRDEREIVVKDKDYLNVKETAAFLGVSRRTIYRLIDSGALIKIKIGSRTIIAKDAIKTMINNQEEHGN